MTYFIHTCFIYGITKFMIYIYYSLNQIIYWILLYPFLIDNSFKFVCSRTRLNSSCILAQSALHIIWLLTNEEEKEKHTPTLYCFNEWKLHYSVVHIVNLRWIEVVYCFVYYSFFLHLLSCIINKVFYIRTYVWFAINRFILVTDKNHVLILPWK